jgi:type I restriction enzyme, S subunit
MSFLRYPNYKETGVEWLGQVPEHWKVLQIRRTTYLKARVGWKGLTSEEFREQAFAYLVTGSDFRAKFVKWDECYQVEKARYDDDPFIQLRNGDLLITKDGTIGKLAIVSNLDRPACLNSGIFVARPRNSYTTEFMYWLLSSTVFSVFCDLESFGSTINHLYQNVFERFAFPAPPESEQLTIAEFLDRETGKIDELIAEQERLIELLKEKRQAVISHAVTKGLNPDVPMKDSGIEWIGQVPEHWNTVPLKSLTQPDRPIMYGIVLPGPDVGEGGVPILKGGNVRPSRLNLDSMARTTVEIEAPYARARLQQGDLVYSIRGTIGDCEIVPPELSGANITQDVARVAIDDQYSTQWARWSLLSSAIREELACGSLGAAVRGINIFDLKRVQLPTPPTKTEQSEIADFLEIEISRFDTLTAEAQKAITLLHERRSALISAAVTGQIHVWAIQHEEAA